MLAPRFCRLLLVVFAAALVCSGSAGAEASDPNAPGVVLESPSEGAFFYQGQQVQAAYACLPGALGWPVVSCLGDVPLGEPVETSRVGAHTFSVLAEDYSGAVTSVTHAYTVIDVIAPTITITAPPDGAEYPVGAAVTVEYSCDDGPGGSGILACIGSLPSGAPLPTDRLGSFSVEVTAFDGAGNSSTRRHSYRVVDATPPTISITRPGVPVGDRLPTYRLGEVVLAEYSCADDGGSGIAACVGGVASGSPLDTASIGAHVFTVVAKDAAHNLTTASRSYRVVYAFAGFSAPLVPFPSFASVKAGAQLPVKFSLNGDFGLGAIESIASRPVDCASAAATDPATPARGELGYSAGPDRYTFQWETERAWLGTCRQLAVALADGAVHHANVRFTK